MSLREDPTQTVKLLQWVLLNRKPDPWIEPSFENDSEHTPFLGSAYFVRRENVC